KQTAYTVCIEDIKGQKKEYMDPYACGTALTAEQRKKLAAGDDWEAYRLFGAHERTVGGIRGVCFAVWAPNAQRVSVVGDFNHWDGRIFPMEKHEDSGIFELFIPEMKAGTAYKYEIKFKGGNIAVKTDPYCRQCDAGQGFASVVYADIPFAWEDGAWQKAEENRDIEKEPVAIYEISPETCRQIKEPEQFAAQIAKLGYTHIELQAVAQYDSRRRNLRETAGYFAPADIFGTPDDLKRLVNAMHKENIGVIADWNAAFMGNLPSGLTWFDGTNLYESSAFCLTPDADVAVSSFQYGKPQVKMFLISNAIMWIKEYHIDGLFVDEVASALYLDYGRAPGEWIPNLYGENENLDAVAFFKQLKKVLIKEKCPAVLIAQDSSTWGRVTGSHEDALGFDFKWNHGWKNDFDKFMQSDPLFRKGVYQKLTDNMLYFYSEFFIQELHITEQELPGSNDGEKHANMRLATAYQYCYPGKKRTAENCTGTLPQSFMEALNAFYKEHPALYTADYEPEGFAWTDTQDEQETVLAFVRRSMVSDSTSQDLLVIANFTPVVRKDFRMGVLEPGKYKEIFNTDAAHFGGQNILNEQQLSSEKVERNGCENSIVLDLPPLALTVYAYEPFTKLELEEIRIREEAELAAKAAQEQAWQAEQLKVKAEEEAQAALEAQKQAELAAKAAQQACEEAEKQAQEAEAAKLKIEQETKKKLAALKRRK
nr:alpha amylase C-terminal domain-containing protein [Lachnospira sp.]